MYIVKHMILDFCLIIGYTCKITKTKTYEHKLPG